MISEERRWIDEPSSIQCSWDCMGTFDQLVLAEIRAHPAERMRSVIEGNSQEKELLHYEEAQ